MTIQELINVSYEIAVAKGWWDKKEDTYIPTKIALMHSELSEALEEYRMFPSLITMRVDEHGKPYGFIVELADLFIRAGDLIGYLNLGKEFEEALQTKLTYNRTRPYRHGGKAV